MGFWSSWLALALAEWVLRLALWSHDTCRCRCSSSESARSSWRGRGGNEELVWHGVHLGHMSLKMRTCVVCAVGGGGQNALKKSCPCEISGKGGGCN